MADLDSDNINDLEIGVIGSGSMGGGMTLLFSELGSRVGCYDYDKKAVETVLRQAREDKIVDAKLVHGFTSLDKMVGAFPSNKQKPRIIVLSLPHGKPVDGMLEELLSRLEKGDVVIDAGNEWWKSTVRRQKAAAEKGVEWVGMGVSGGYQAARHGPSMSPGCTEAAYKVVEPYLKKWAVKTKQGEPCVMRIGPGGSGHYVKMIHNGIEHAHLSILCEVRGLLYHQLGMSNDEISSLFGSWVKSGPLRGNFLLDIGAKALKFKKGDGLEDERGIVEGIEDKVTQDVDLSEGTGTWSAGEIADRHVAAPAIAASHQLRIISADHAERLVVVKNLKIPQPGKDTAAKAALLEVMESAVYGAVLGAFVQGLQIITKASTMEKWDVSLLTCIKIWRAGCIIQSDAIAEFLMPLFKSFPPSQPLNLLHDIPEIATELSGTYAAMKKVYAYAIETDAVAPAVGATLEWLKAIGGENLPTDFEEMELDYFGHHNYDRKMDATKGHSKGAYHTEFQST